VFQVDVTPLDGSGVTLPTPTGSPAKWTGTGTGGDILPTSCLLMKLNTAQRGRSHRGRIYLPFLNTNNVGDGKIGSSIQASVTTAWVAYKTALASAGAPLQVASYVLASSADVVAIAAETYEATQRRRLHRTSATA